MTIHGYRYVTNKSLIKLTIGGQNSKDFFIKPEPNESDCIFYYPIIHSQAPSLIKDSLNSNYQIWEFPLEIRNSKSFAGFLLQNFLEEDE